MIARVVPVDVVVEYLRFDRSGPGANADTGAGPAVR
jgi:hypothetical protein